MAKRVLLLMGLVLLAGCETDPAEPPLIPADVDASRGFEALRRGEDAIARAFFTRALETDPENAYALHGMDMVFEPLPPEPVPVPIAPPALEPAPPAPVVEVIPRPPAAVLPTAPKETPPLYEAVPFPFLRP